MCLHFPEAKVDCINVNCIKINYIKINYIKVNCIKVKCLKVNCIKVNCINVYCIKVDCKLQPLIKEFLLQTVNITERRSDTDIGRKYASFMK